MDKEQILDVAQKHLSLNNGSYWIGNDDSIADFGKEVFAAGVESVAAPVAAALPASDADGTPSDLRLED